MPNYNKFIFYTANKKLSPPSGKLCGKNLPYRRILDYKYRRIDKITILPHIP